MNIRALKFSFFEKEANDNITSHHEQRTFIQQSVTIIKNGSKNYVAEQL